jgi:hypothetical protein
MKATRFVVFPVDIEDEVELSEMNYFSYWLFLVISIRYYF